MFMLTIPTLFSGCAQIMENLAVASYLLTKEIVYADIASKITPMRTMSGGFSYGVFILLGLLSLVFGIKSIGRDKRQVIEKKRL